MWSFLFSLALLIFLSAIVNNKLIISLKDGTEELRAAAAEQGIIIIGKITYISHAHYHVLWNIVWFYF